MNNKTSGGRPNNTSLWRIGVTIMTAFIITGVGWLFSEVRDLPACYPTKIEVRESVKGVRLDLGNRLDREHNDLNDRLKRIEDKLDMILMGQTDLILMRQHDP